MTMLTRAAAERARGYLFAFGRRLDQARFRFHFEGGPAAAVLAELEQFQNPDGGFGHALEPDLRTQASSAAATERAFCTFREVGAGADEPTVGRAVTYLRETYDAELVGWPIVPAAVEDAPHAPWWSYPDSADTFGGFRLNPTAGLLGALYEYRELVEPGWLADLTSAMVDRLRAAPADMDLNDYRCVLTLASTPDLPDELRQAADDVVRRAVGRAIGHGPDAWVTYGLQPLEVAPTPDSLLAGILDRAAIDASGDFWVARQLPDGSWPLTWDWSFVDEAAWAQAERDVKGFLIVERLAALAAYGRLG